MSYNVSRFLDHSALRSFVGLVLLSALLAGCGGGRSTPEQGKSISIPVGLLLEQEIKGRVLGHYLKAPSGVAVDRRGTLYLVDEGNNRILWFNADWRALRVIDGSASRSGLFDEPRAVAVDHNLNLWVADTGNRRLVQYSEFLEFVDEIDLYEAEEQVSIGQPSGIAVSRFGETYVSDDEFDHVMVLNTFGRLDRYVGDFGYSGGNLDEPAGMAIDHRDHIFVCDPGNSRVMYYDDRGGVIREMTHETLDEPCAVALDAIGRQWVLDRATAQLSCFAPDGHLLATVGPIITGAGKPLRSPLGLAVTAHGYLAIADTGNDRLLICRILSEVEE